MVIVEGPDGSGKSQLIRRLGLKAVHLKSLRGGVGGTTPEGWGAGDPAIVAYVKKIREAVADPLLAYDRFHLSEHVYGPMLRNKQELPGPDLQMVNDYIHQHKIPVILCLPDFAQTLKVVALEGRPRPEYQTEGFLHQAYVLWQTMAPWATHVFDYTRDPLPTL